MPLEIKELHIKVAIDSGNHAEQSSTASSPVGGNNLPAMDINKIIASCVEEVLEILKDQQER